MREIDDGSVKCTKFKRLKMTMKGGVMNKKIIRKTVTKVKTCTFRAEQPPAGIHLGKASHFARAKFSCQLPAGHMV